jgi:hypothetical protein
MMTEYGSAAHMKAGSRKRHKFQCHGLDDTSEPKSAAGEIKKTGVGIPRYMHFAMCGVKQDKFCDILRKYTVFVWVLAVNIGAQAPAESNARVARGYGEPVSAGNAERKKLSDGETGLSL